MLTEDSTPRLKNQQMPDRKTKRNPRPTCLRETAENQRKLTRQTSQTDSPERGTGAGASVGRRRPGGT